MSERARIGVVAAVLAIVILAVPLYLDSFWLQLLLVTIAMATSAMGLTLLVGFTGQLSLAHAFFMAIGAYAYAALAAEPAEGLQGFDLPPILAAVVAVGVAGIAGGLFSPVSGRLGGLYLGVASLGLVFLGQYLLTSWESVSGGFSGRRIASFELLGLSFTDASGVVVLGVPFRRLELLWLGAAISFVVLMLLTRRFTRSRRGLELSMVRVSEEAAGALGINVGAAKRNAFIVSSLYAGAGGVLLALVLQRVVPEAFGLMLSINLLAMIVIGGMRSALGALLGAVFVSALPMLLQRYSAAIPFMARPGSAAGIDAATLATYVYGILIIVVLVLWPSGLVGMARALRATVRRQVATKREPVGVEPASSDVTVEV